MEKNFLSLIKTRRSVRAYKSESVPSKALDTVLEAGTYAPTGGGHQSPTIIAITDPKYRRVQRQDFYKKMWYNVEYSYIIPRGLQCALLLLTI